MSLSSGNRNRRQAHQNKTAFQHNPHSKKTERILTLVDSSDLCPRCQQKIEWRKKYRKYKPLKHPASCSYCRNKTIVSAYHQACPSCAAEREICPSCLRLWADINNGVVDVDVDEHDDDNNDNDDGVDDDSDETGHVELDDQPEEVKQARDDDI